MKDRINEIIVGINKFQFEKGLLPVNEEDLLFALRSDLIHVNKNYEIDESKVFSVKDFRPIIQDIAEKGPAWLHPVMYSTDVGKWLVIVHMSRDFGREDFPIVFGFGRNSENIWKPVHIRSKS